MPMARPRLDPAAEELQQQLTQLHWWQELDPVRQARLLPHLQLRSLQPGTVLQQQGHPIQVVHYLIDGSIQLQSGPEGEGRIREQGFLPEDVCRPLQPARCTAICQSDCLLLAVDACAFDHLLQRDPDLQRRVLTSVVLEDPGHLVRPRSPAMATPASSKQLLWWLLTLCVPVISYAVLINNAAAIDHDQILFICIACAALLLWIGELVPTVAPALLILVSLSLLSIAPNEEILSGFSNDSFLLLVSLYVVGGLIKSSGLAFRLCLQILNHAPARQGPINAVLCLLALALNPILPSATSRSSILTPVLLDMKQNLNLPDRSRAFTQMAMFTYAGISVLSFVFLSSKSENLIVYALLPEQVRDRFSISEWTLQSLPLAIPLLVGIVLCCALVFRNNLPLRIQHQTIQSQLLLLGPLSRGEWQALGSIAVFLIGSSTASLHGFSMAWVSVLILCYLLTCGAVSIHALQRSVDWSFLLFLAAIIGMSNALPFSDLDELLGHSLQGMGALLENNTGAFAVAFAVLIYGLRLLMPPKLVAPVMATIFIPIATHHNINPWVPSMMILLYCDAAFMPYQHATLMAFLAELDGHVTIQNKSFYLANHLINILRVVALLIALPIWSLNGIL